MLRKHNRNDSGDRFDRRVATLCMLGMSISLIIYIATTLYLYIHAPARPPSTLFEANFILKAFYVVSPVALTVLILTLRPFSTRTKTMIALFAIWAAYTSFLQVTTQSNLLVVLLISIICELIMLLIYFRPNGDIK